MLHATGHICLLFARKREMYVVVIFCTLKSGIRGKGILVPVLDVCMFSFT